jgi:hypothetical protein
VAKQRTDHKKNKLLEDRMDRLNDIGFVWVPNTKTESGTTKWNSMFDKLEDFCKKNGHCLVPCKPKQDKTPHSLATWVAAQRSAHKKNKLLEDRMEQLNNIGFDWVVIARGASFRWEERCDQLDEHKKHNGNCLAPSD